MGSLVLRVGYWLVGVIFLLGAQANDADIGWETEISQTLELLQQDFETESIDQNAGDLFANGFVTITPLSIIEGDFEELKEHLLSDHQESYYLSTTPNIVATCDDTALVWSYIRENAESTDYIGTYVILFEYTDSKAKIKLLHTTV